MLIGEFAERTGLSARTLRHCEERGLLVPEGRTSSGYRDYNETQVATGRRVRQLLDAGLPTRLIVDVLDVIGETGEVYPQHRDATASKVHDEWQRMCRCIECMTHRRDALAGFLQQLTS